MAEYRQIHTKIWADEWFLEQGSDAKLLFIYLFSNRRSCLAGIYDISTKLIAFETGLDRARIEALLALFAEDGKAFYEDGYIWIPKLLLYNAANVASPKIQAHIKTNLESVPDIPLRVRWIAYWEAHIPYQCPIDTLSIPRRDRDHEQEHDHEHDHEPEQEDHAADAPAADAARDAIPSTFPEWQERIKTATRRAPVLRWMIENLYPGLDPPAYSYINKIAKEVGGAGRLADLLWQHSTRPPTGDLLSYIRKVAKNAKYRDNSKKPIREVEQATGWIDRPAPVPGDADTADVGELPRGAGQPSGP